MKKKIPAAKPRSNAQKSIKTKHILRAVYIPGIYSWFETVFQWRSYIGGHVAGAPLPTLRHTLRPSILKVIFLFKNKRHLYPFHLKILDFRYRFLRLRNFKKLAIGLLLLAF
jgi:hypothetical protein